MKTDAPEIRKRFKIGRGGRVGAVALAVHFLLTGVAAADPVQDFRDRIDAAALVHAHEAEPVRRIEDVRIAGPYGEIAVRIYDASQSHPTPVVLYVHGAGWIGGSVASHDNITRKLANELAVMVISVEYRLAPEFPYPAALEESFAVLKWMHTEAENLGLDPHRIAVAGDSSGGNLAAALSLVTRDRQGPQLSAQVLINPALDLTAFDLQGACAPVEEAGPFATMMVFFRDHYVPAGTDPAQPYVSPLLAPDVSGLPPALVITGSLDLLCRAGEAYAARLQEAGVPAKTWRADSVGHYGMTWAVADATIAPAMEATTGFLQQVWSGY